MTLTATPLPRLTQHTWANVRTELIWVYDREVREHGRMTHSDIGAGNKVWLIRKGEVTITTSSGNPMNVTEGQWVFLPNEYTRQRFSEGAKILSIFFLCQWPSGDRLFQESSGLIINSADFPRLEKRAHALEKTVRRYQSNAITEHKGLPSDYGLFLKMQSLFIQWLSEWYRTMIALNQQIAGFQTGDNRVLEILRYLNEAPLDGSFPLEELEKGIRLGEAHLNRIFLQKFGITTRKYWEARKLMFAKMCLESGSMPIKEIAYRLAFRSDAYFVVWFRRLAGCRPGEYRHRTAT